MDEAEAIKMSSLIETHTVQAPVVAQYRPAFMAPPKKCAAACQSTKKAFCRFLQPLCHRGSAIPSRGGVGGLEGIRAAQLIGTRRTQDWDVLGVG